MLAGKNFPVPVPKSSDVGRTVLNGNYVYWVTKAVWDREKKCSRDNRVSIGRLCDDNPEMMWPGKNYIELFSYLPSTNKLVHNSVMSIGIYLFALKSAEKTGCLTAIKAALQDRWPKAFALIVEWIDNECSVSQYFEHLFFDNFYGFYTPLDPAAITRFYEELSHLPYALETYPKVFHEEYRRRFLSDSRDIKRAVGCDSTNFNHVSKDNELLGYGHAKEDKAKPIYAYMNFVDEETGMTMYGMYHPGPLLDKTQISYTLERAIELGFEQLHMMFDRGFLTEANAAYFQKVKKEHGIVFSAMVPGTYNFVEQYIEENRGKLSNNEEYYIACEDIYGMRLKDEPLFMTEKEIAKHGKNDQAKLFDVYLFYDDRRAADERGAISDKVSFRLEQARAATKYSKTLANAVSPEIILTPCTPDPETGVDFVIEKNITHIQKRKNNAGFFLTVSNSGESPTNEIVIVRRRDKSEKSYSRRKSFFDLTTPGNGDNDSFRGKCLLADMAQNVIEGMEYYGKPFIGAKRSETLETMICELRKVKIHFDENGVGTPLFALTHRQKELFSCLDLSQEVIDEYLRGIRWGQTPEMIYTAAEQKAAAKEARRLQREAEKSRKAAERAAERERKAAERTAKHKRQTAKHTAEKEHMSDELVPDACTPEDIT